MNQLEQQLVWLAGKVKHDGDLIERLEDYCDSHHHGWSKEVTNSFLTDLEQRKMQLDYEEHRLELLCWKVVEDRESRGEVPDREALFIFNEVTGSRNPN